MFQQLLIAAAVKAMQMALCSLFGFCINQEDCPDGVCDDALRSIDSLGDENIEPVVSPEKTRAFDFDIRWDQLKPLVDATVAFIDALKSFLGLSRNVG